MPILDVVNIAGHVDMRRTGFDTSACDSGEGVKFQVAGVWCVDKQIGKMSQRGNEGNGTCLANATGSSCVHLLRNFTNLPPVHFLTTSLACLVESCQQKAGPRSAGSTFPAGFLCDTCVMLPQNMGDIRSWGQNQKPSVSYEGEHGVAAIELPELLNGKTIRS